MTKKTCKILLVQVMNQNLGDSVIGDCNAWLIQRAMRFRCPEIIRYNIATRDFGQIKYVDAVIFAGGILKTTNEKFHVYIPEILHEAERWSVPVFFSAISAEPHFPDEEASCALKQALNLPCVKGISVRDDVRMLKEHWIENPAIRVDVVADPALWSEQVYGVSRIGRAGAGSGNAACGVIGLGVTRWKLFADYGHPEISREQQLAFWTELIALLDAEGMQWKLFTNGDPNDEAFADEVLDAVGHGEKLPCPRDSRTLVEMIAGFSGVFAGRMHANIIAHALAIPCGGYVWNKKLRFFAEKCGFPERFIEPEQLTAQAALESIHSASGNPKGPGRALLQPVYQALRVFLKKWGVVRKAPEARKEQLDYAAHMFATSLGAVQQRYKNTNSKEALAIAGEAGYRHLSVSIGMSRDGVPVLVDGWNRATYKALGLPAGAGGTAGAASDALRGEYEPLASDAFCALRYYNRFTPLALAEFLDRYERWPGRTQESKLFLCADDLPSEVLARIVADLMERVSRGRLSSGQCVIRVKDPAVIQALSDGRLSALDGIDWMYRFPAEDVEEDARAEAITAAIARCRVCGAAYFALYAPYYDRAVERMIRDAHLKSAVFSYNKVGGLIKALRWGADFAGSHYYGPDYLCRLTH